MISDGPVVRLGLEEGLHRLRVVRAHRDLRDVDVAVASSPSAPRSFLRGRLAARGELGDRAARRGLRRLPAGVGVDLGVEHQHVDVAARGQDVVEAADSRCRRPSRRRRRSRRSSSPAHRRARDSSRASAIVACPRGARLQRCHALALRRDAGLGRSGRPPSSAVGQRRRRSAGASRSHQLARVLAPACPAPGACRGRTRRCPRTASCPGRAAAVAVARPGVVGRLPP